MRLAVIFVLALTLHLTYSEDARGQNAEAQEKSFVEKLRPKLMRFLGEEWTVKLIGENPTPIIPAIALPPIPKIDDNAKSVAVYEKKQDKIILPPEIEQKFSYTYIKEVYSATRQAKASEEEINQMMNVLTQGGTREGVYRAFVLDSVYGAMENWDKPVKSNSADFAVFFYEKYLGRKIAKKSFEGMNIYTLKRLITEKTLEVADAFGEDRDGLESWYAVMSGDFATKFPLIWTNETRKKTSSIEHKSWASHVPVQHIKSEVIIKLHSAFNSLNN